MKKVHVYDPREETMVKVVEDERFFSARIYYIMLLHEEGSCYDESRSR
jgi:hypothetical protein